MQWIFVALLAMNALCALAGFTGFLGQHSEVSVAEQATSFPAPIRTLSHVVSGERTSTPRIVADGCPAIGPIGDVKHAGELAAVLRDAGYRSELRASDVRQTYYWVFLPPADSADRNVRRLREMHAVGIESFLVGEGADKNAISLGLFAMKSSALGIQSRLRALGYDAQIREQVRTRDGSWIVLERQATGYLEHAKLSLGNVQVGWQDCILR
jgi:hypothetical protein